MTEVPPQDPYGQEGVPTPPPFGQPVPSTPPPPQPFGQPVPPPSQPQAPQGYPPYTPPGAPQPGTYYSNQQGYVVSGPKTDPFSITSMVTGIVGVPLICCWPIAAVLGAVATIFGSLSLGRIKKSNGLLGGKGMAIAGLVLGIVVLVGCLGILVLSLIGEVSDYQF